MTQHGGRDVTIREKVMSLMWCRESVLRPRVRALGGVRRFATKYGISAAYVSDALGGRREIGPRLAGILHLKKVVIRTVRYEYAPNKRGSHD